MLITEYICDKPLFKNCPNQLFPLSGNWLFEVVKNALEKFMSMIPTVSYNVFVFFKANAIFYVLGLIL